MDIKGKIKSSLINILTKYRNKAMSREFYTSTADDIFNTRIHTLENGLKVYLTKLPNAPVINTRIVIKSGSSQDPHDATGLAHYLEHMLFKGSKNFGTVDYDKEKEHLDKIKKLYTKYRKTKDETERKDIWAQINRVSKKASSFAIANEYNKMLNFIGATGTNAHTSNEETVYKNNIPSDQLEIWLKIELERFTNPVFRLFHTELEVVYEEMNRFLANENSQAYSEILKNLFPTHPYGQRMTIGTEEHLKNPSLDEIEKYFNKYYVANNMAICLSGDIDFDKTVALIEMYWTPFKNKHVQLTSNIYEENIVSPVRKIINGQREPILFMGFRLKNVGITDMALIEIMDMLLYNGISGLIDQNLVNNHRIYGSGSYINILREYSFHILIGIPKAGTELRRLEELFNLQLQLIKAGEFSDELFNSVKLNIRLSWEKTLESNNDRLEHFTKAFGLGIEWDQYLSILSKIDTLVKEDIIRFANYTYNNNYARIHKEQLNSAIVNKFQNPEITPIDINRLDKSKFLKDIELESMGIPIKDPVLFAFDNNDEFKKVVEMGQEMLYKSGKDESEFFELRYVYDIGLNNNRELGISMEYLNSTPTKNYSLQEIKNKLYSFGSSYNIYTGGNKIQIILQGSNRHFEHSINFLEEIIREHVIDETILSGIKNSYNMESVMNTMDKDKIKNAIIEHIKYGDKSIFKRRLNTVEVSNVTKDAVIKNITDVFALKHRVFYYGDKPFTEVNSVIKKYHRDIEYNNVSELKIRKELIFPKAPYYYYKHEIPQAEMMIITQKQQLTDLPKLVNNISKINLYNTYFGMGMSSRIFQEIREAKALAYSAYSYFKVPFRLSQRFYNITYIGTQHDKLKEAHDCIFKLLDNTLEITEDNLDALKRSYKLKLSTKRLLGINVIDEHERLNNLGLEKSNEKNEYHKTIYNTINSVRIDDMIKLHSDINMGSRIIAVLGPEGVYDVLSNYGPVTTFTKEDIFNI